MIQKAFAIGNSVAVTVPKKFGLLPGTRLKHLPSKKNRISYEILGGPVRKVRTKRAAGNKEKEIEDYVRRHGGSIKLNIPTAEVMEIIRYCHDNPYDKI